jgi:pimeloyl-ACP methyl ester carboxylesterase
VFKSTKLLIGLLKSPKGIVSKTTCLLINKQHYQVKHYTKKTKNECHTILVIGGFSVHGYKDVRLNNIAKSFAGVGYRVLVFSISDIENLVINTDTIYEVREIIKALCDEYYFSSGGKVSIFAPSFSAGLVLAACTDTQIQSRVSSICCIGTYANLETTFEYILFEENADDYARNILFKNMLPYSKYSTIQDLKFIVETAIYDNGFKRFVKDLPQVYKNASKQSQEIWNKWNDSKDFRKEFIKSISNEKVLQNWKSEFDVFTKIKQIKTPITFIHGSKDDVIPKTESMQLHQERKALGLPSHLCITNLISHGDTKSSSISTIEYINITKAFNYFFNYAKL